MLQLYKNIKQRRTDLHLTQSKLAEKMGYADKSMIAKIEKGLIDLPQSKIIAFAEALHVSPSDLMGWEQYDSHFSGKEAPKEVYSKFITNIEKHHGKLKELEDVYVQLSSDNQVRVNSYAKKLYDIQQMDDALAPVAAHSRTDVEHTPEGQKHDLDIMMNDDEW